MGRVRCVRGPEQEERSRRVDLRLDEADGLVRQLTGVVGLARLSVNLEVLEVSVGAVIADDDMISGDDNRKRV